MNETDTEKAVARAKFKAASELDSRACVASPLGNKVLRGPGASIKTTLSISDAVSSSPISLVSSLYECVQVDG